MDFREINKFNWRLNLNNNNNLVELSLVSKYNSPDAADGHQPELVLRPIDCSTGAATMGTKQKQGATTPAHAEGVGDEGIGNGASGGGGVGDGLGDGAAGVLECEDFDKESGGAAYCDMDMGVAGYSLAAAVLPSAEVASGGGLSSNRTSMNNSTENLSYASDNFYGDDLILLDDDDVDAEEISLNSDDCVYAYRGDGADFDLALDASAMGRGARHHLDIGLGSGSTGKGAGGSLICGDDETEFLEMDFEPDPPSELEFAGGTQNLASLPQANLLLMQRDYSQMSGKGGTTPTQGRQLYSSPIDDFSPEDVLQQQKQRLSNKFARISLNLDQIKDGAGAATGASLDLDEQIGGRAEESVGSSDIGQSMDSAQAHSLPSTLGTGVNFGRSTSVPNDHPEPNRTGAKPKRLSHSSSVMSKSSSASKSRRSQPSESFDERCYSCTDFRAASTSSSSGQQRHGQVAPMLVAAAAVVALASSSSSMAHFELASNEENCLDCLEKEFLANTIGKALDLSTCAKCRRRAGGRGSSLSLYARADQTRCRSGSPGYFEEAGGLFAGWYSTSAAGTVPGPSLGSPGNQRFISCDNNFRGVQLLKQSFPTESIIARLSTEKECDEEHVAKALDKLHVSYDQALLHAYFEQMVTRPSAHNLNIKQLLLKASKQQGNYRKLKRIIELVTQNQLIVQFERAKDVQKALVPVRVADLLDAWSHHRDLSILRQLDARFHRANVIGKVGHIVRQAAAASSSQVQAASSFSSSRRTLPEYLMIPQYYESGELTLRRKC
ncbi:uncharacterized protein Dana_GF14522 [Drosophila ananassae]|uniref:Uncharacterized protein n=1 Tax=Drosophila ananassae TaxID=7217 RepID=B3MK79_DROAN|nr:uncharacterized protein LOC6497345 [Drosophila ananassae]EDV31497.2 uncharacterized protein Dana_GF14522 [Drosophila ananassae]